LKLWVVKIAVKSSTNVGLEVPLLIGRLLQRSKRMQLLAFA